MKGQFIQLFIKSKDMKFHMLVEKVGEGSKIPLDGRLSLAKCCAIATQYCRDNNEAGFRICRKSTQGGWSNYKTDCYKVFANSVEC